MKPYITLHGTDYVLISNITKFFKDVFKSNVTKDETEYVLSMLNVPFETMFLYVIGNYARCYRVFDIENLIRYKRSKVLDLITMKRHLRENPPKIEKNPKFPKYDNRTEEEIEADERRKRLLAYSKDDIPDKIPGEDMDTVSRELLKQGEVYY